jgi:hypothetical protein
MRHAGKEPFPIIYVDAKEEGQVKKFALLVVFCILFEIRTFLYNTVTCLFYSLTGFGKLDLVCVWSCVCE